MAKREAHARSIPPVPDAPSAQSEPSLEHAQRALAQRVEAFTQASEALRAEIKAFDAALSGAEGRPAERELRLIVSRETAEIEAVDAAEEAGEVERDRPTPAQIAEIFRTYERREDPEPARAEVSVATAPRPRNLARERLYADIGGAIIGLSGAAALINFVLLK